MEKVGTEIHSFKNRNFGKRLQELRKGKGLTQIELAEQMNVSEKAVKRWEQGRAAPSVESLAIISDFFECDYDYLLGRQDTPNKVYHHISEYTGLSESAVSILATAKENGDPSINIIDALIKGEYGLLSEIYRLSTADYGVASRFWDIDDPFSPRGKTPILVSPRDLYRADCMQLYEALLKFIRTQREKNELGRFVGETNDH